MHERVTVIPTITHLTDNVELYLREMLDEHILMPLCVVDDSSIKTSGKNREFLQELCNRINKEALERFPEKSEGGMAPIPLYHFSNEEQHSLFSKLACLSADHRIFDLIRRSPSYGNARNKAFIMARCLGAKLVFCFDDDTHPIKGSGIFRKYTKAFEKHPDVAAVSGKYRGDPGVLPGYTGLQGIDRVRLLDAGEVNRTFFVCKDVKTMKRMTRLMKDDERKISPMILGGNFAINGIYEHTPLPPAIRTPATDDIFLGVLVSLNDGKVLAMESDVMHKHYGEKKSDFVLNQHMTTYVRQKLFFTLLQKCSEYLAVIPGARKFTPNVHARLKRRFSKGYKTRSPLPKISAILEREVAGRKLPEYAYFSKVKDVLGPRTSSRKKVEKLRGMMMSEEFAREMALVHPICMTGINVNMTSITYLMIENAYEKRRNPVIESFLMLKDIKEYGELFRETSLLYNSFCDLIECAFNDYDHLKMSAMIYRETLRSIYNKHTRAAADLVDESLEEIVERVVEDVLSYLVLAPKWRIIMRRCDNIRRTFKDWNQAKLELFLGRYAEPPKRTLFDPVEDLGMITPGV